MRIIMDSYNRIIEIKAICYNTPTFRRVFKIILDKTRSEQTTLKELTVSKHNHLSIT